MEVDMHACSEKGRIVLLDERKRNMRRREKASLSWHHDDRKKAGPEESDEMTQILKPEVQVKSAQLRQHAKVNCLQSSSSLPPSSPPSTTNPGYQQVGRQQLDTSSELSGLTKDDGDGDKATPSSEEGDDDDGPVMPKAIIPGHPPKTKGFSTYCHYYCA